GAARDRAPAGARGAADILARFDARPEPGSVAFTSRSVAARQALWGGPCGALASGSSTALGVPVSALSTRGPLTYASATRGALSVHRRRVADRVDGPVSGHRRR